MWISPSLVIILHVQKYCVARTKPTTAKSSEVILCEHYHGYNSTIQELLKSYLSYMY